jgi:Protein O-mannosyl-transferase TMEM260-like
MFLTRGHRTPPHLALNTQLSNERRSTDWPYKCLSGAGPAVICGLIYLALRPPLHDRDGYVYRLYAKLPSRFYNVNPHHLVWNTIQMLLVDIGRFLNHPGTVLFQIFGIFVSCIVLLVFALLLYSASHKPLLAVLGAMLVAFSPKFWYLTFQNQPYPLLFLAIVLYLCAWRTPNGHPPSGLHLAAAALLLSVAVLLQQAIVLWVPAGALVLLSCGGRSRRSRLFTASTWAGGVLALVACAYLIYWHTLHTGQTFFHWTTQYLASQHSLQFEFPKALAAGSIGVLSAAVQTEPLDLLLQEHFSPDKIWLFYSFLGLVIAILIGWTAWRMRVLKEAAREFRHNALFTVSLFSIACWSAFVLVWEPETAYYWVLNLFPGLLCVSIVLRNRPIGRRWLLVGTVLSLVLWNAYFDHMYDRFYSDNFPPPILESISKHVGPNGLFVVLGNREWYGQMNYDLIFTCLKYSPTDRGVAILDDLVMHEKSPKSWTEDLRAKIQATLDTHGRVFVASHVFNPESYADLARANSAFAPFVQKRYLGLDGRELYWKVRAFFKGYNLVKSTFAIGKDPFLEVEKRP